MRAVIYKYFAITCQGKTVPKLQVQVVQYCLCHCFPISQLSTITDFSRLLVTKYYLTMYVIIYVLPR
jgi:hypothetical protein